MSWDSPDGFINHPGENAARFRFPPTSARALAQNAHPDSLHWDHRPGETQRGDTTGRHNGETQRGDTKGRQRGERKGGTKRKSKMKNVTFIVCKPEKLLCNILKC